MYNDYDYSDYVFRTVMLYQGALTSGLRPVGLDRRVAKLASWSKQSKTSVMNDLLALVETLN